MHGGNTKFVFILKGRGTLHQLDVNEAEMKKIN
jgi:hypothetical protein